METVNILTEGWDTSSVETMEQMFWYSNIPTIDLTNLDTSSVTNANKMFNNATFGALILGNKTDISLATENPDLTFITKDGARNIKTFDELAAASATPASTAGTWVVGDPASAPAEPSEPSSPAAPSDRQSISVPTDGTLANGNVNGVFALNADDLSDLGYEAIVVLPVEITLSYDDITKHYSGSDTGIYASGTVASDKKVNLSVKEQSSTITGPNSETYTIPYSAENGYTASLTKTEWSSEEALNNMNAVEGLDGKMAEDLSKSTISIDLDGHSFVPRSSGNFEMPVQVTISLADAA